MRRILIILICCIGTLASKAYMPMGDIVRALYDDPNNISNDTIRVELENQLTFAFDNDYQSIATLLRTINADSVRRSVIQKFYFPLQTHLLQHYVSKSKLIKIIAQGRDFEWDGFKARHYALKGADINGAFNVNNVLISCAMDISQMDRFGKITTLTYGSAYQFEDAFWGDNRYMNQVVDLPFENLIRIGGDSGDSYEDFFYSLSNCFTVFLNGNAKVDESYLHDLGCCLTFLPQQVGNNVCSAVIRILMEEYAYSADEIPTIVGNLMALRTGMNNSESQLNAQYIYRNNSSLDEMNSFLERCQNLSWNNIEYAYKRPSEFWNKYSSNDEYLTYRDEYITYFRNFLNTAVNSPTKPIVGFEAFGIFSYNDLLNTYCDELLDVFYTTPFRTTIGYLDDLFELLIKRPGTLWGTAIFDMAEAYAPINPKKSIRLLFTFGHYLNKSKNALSKPEYIKDWNSELYAAALNAMIYSDCHLDSYNNAVLEVAKEVEANFNKLTIGVNDRNHIRYAIATAYYNLGDTAECLRMCKTAEKSEVWDDLFKKLSINALVLEGDASKSEEILALLKNFRHIKIEDMLGLMSMCFKIKNDEYLQKLSSSFNVMIHNDLNDLIFMEPDDQEWAANIFRFNVNRQLVNLLATYVDKFGTAGNNPSEFTLKYSHIVPALAYNWILASKGILLRSRNMIRNTYLTALSEQQLEFYNKHVNSEKYDQLRHMADNILLDIIRNDDQASNVCNVDFFDVRNSLKEHESAVEFLQINDLVYALILNSNSQNPLLEYIGLASELKNEANSNKIWTRIQDKIGNSTTIYYSPDGILNVMNLELLTDETGNYDLDRFTFVRVSTTGKLPKSHGRTDFNNAAIYADLNYASQWTTDKDFGKDFVDLPISRWAALHDSRAEIEALSKVFDPSNLIVKSGDEGHKQSLLALDGNSPSVLHLATHTFFNPYAEKTDGTLVDAMQRAGIALSGSEPDMYYSKNSTTLFANELVNLDFNNIDLLVLSACDAGLGEISSDGIVGLQRGFKQAGVKSILMSLTKVDSRDISKFMEGFYRRIASGENIREAFNNTRIAFASEGESDVWKNLILID